MKKIIEVVSSNGIFIALTEDGLSYMLIKNADGSTSWLLINEKVYADNSD